MTADHNPSATDPGLTVLVALLRFQGIGADPEQIRHRMGMATIGVPEMARCAKDLGLKARVRSSAWDRLATTPQPSIAVLRDGGCLLLGTVHDDKAIVQYPHSPRSTLMSRAEFEAVWNGQLVLMTQRTGLIDLARRF